MIGLRLGLGLSRPGGGGVDPVATHIATTTAMTGLLHYYTALDADSVTVQDDSGTDRATTWVDQKASKNLTSPLANAGVWTPADSQMGGQNSINFNRANDYMATATTTAFRYGIMVLSYKDGVDAAFDNFNGFVYDTASGDVFRGETGAATIHQTNTEIKEISRNGATASTTMLPLPCSVIRFTHFTASTNMNGQHYWGYNPSVAASRSSLSHGSELLLFDNTLNETEYAAYLTRAYNLFGITP